MTTPTRLLPLLSLLAVLLPAGPLCAEEASPKAEAAAAKPGPAVYDVIADQGIRHDFIAVDEGMNHLLRVDERTPSHNWVVKIGREHPRDLQPVGGGLVLLGHDNGYNLYEIATGRLVKSLATYHDVSSVLRLANGHTLLIGIEQDKPAPPKAINDPKGRHVIMLELDAADVPVRRTAYPGDYVRLMRPTPQGTFLIGWNKYIREIDATGGFLPWQGPIRPDLEKTHCWMAVRLPDGHVIAAGGYAAFMAEFDAAGNVLRRFGGAGSVPAGVHPFFYAAFQVLPNGHIVAANWQGHGKNHGQSGIQLVEFDPAGHVVWGWSDRRTISSLQGVLVLDGLDTAKLHDERHGPMLPAE